MTRLDEPYTMTYLVSLPLLCIHAPPIYPYIILYYFSCFKWEFFRLDRLMRVLSLPRFPTELPDDVTLLALAPQNILVRHESIETNRPPRMNPSRADPHLGTKTIAKTIREARARIHERAGRIDPTHERATGIGRLCDDAVRMVRAVLVDVCDGGR